MDRLNTRLVAVLAIGTLFVVIVGRLLHDFQAGRLSEVLLAQAREAEQAGDLRRSYRLYERYLNARPEDAKGRIELAALADRIAQGVGGNEEDLAQADGLWLRAVEAAPQDHARRLRFVQFLLRPPRPQYERAAAQLEQLWQAGRRDAEVVSLLVQMRIRLGQTDAALQTGLQAIGYDVQADRFVSQSPRREVEVYMACAALLHDKERAQTALKVMRRLIEVEPSSSLGRLRYAEYLLQYERANVLALRTAADAIDEAERLGADHRAVVVARANLDLAQGDAAAAYERLAHAASQHLQHESLQRDVSLAALRRHDPAAAERYLRQALAVLPGNMMLSTLLAEAEIRQGDFASARRAIEDAGKAGHEMSRAPQIQARLLALEAQSLAASGQVVLESAMRTPRQVARWFGGAPRTAPSADSLLRQADARLLAGDTRAAEGLYRRAMLSAGEESSRAIAANNLAYLLAFQDSRGLEAVRLAQQALSVLGPTADTLDSAAVAWLAAGDPLAAIACLEGTIKKAPPSPAVAFHMAWAHEAAGNRPGAAAWLGRAKKLGFRPPRIEQSRYDWLSRRLMQTP